MSIFAIILAILLCIHAIMAGFTITKTAKTIVFTKKQKTYNIILIVVIPFFWSVLIYYMLKKEPYSYEIEAKNDYSSNNFDESGLGAPGSGIGSR
jgi:hypothetical protein